MRLNQWINCRSAMHNYIQLQLHGKKYNKLIIINLHLQYIVSEQHFFFDDVHIFKFIKYAKKWVHCDWSEQVHYISIKHMLYITHVRCWQRYIYNVCSLHHQYEWVQFMIPFIKEIKKLVPRTLLRYILSTWDFLRTLEKCEKQLPVAHASLALLSFS